MNLMVLALKAKIGHPLRKFVLVKLADNANDEGHCWPSYQCIADHCEISRRSVIEHIKVLQQQGFLSIYQRKGQKGHSSNMYKINSEALVQAMHAEKEAIVPAETGSFDDRAGPSAAHSLSSAGDSLPPSAPHSPPSARDSLPPGAPHSPPSAGDALPLVNVVHPESVTLEPINESSFVDRSKNADSSHVDSVESTPDPGVDNLNTQKRFSNLAKVFNQTFADCESVKKISMQAKATNKKRMALVPPAWSFGQQRVLALVKKGLVPEATGAEVVRWFERYFAECLKDPFINGSQARGKGHEAWKASFEYLMRITELEKRVLEEG